MSNATGDDDGSFSSGNTGDEPQLQTHFDGLGVHPISNGSVADPTAAKKKRKIPGTPDPTAEVIALSPMTLMSTNRFVCEICNKGFKRDQNLQLHRRGHNLPWKLRQRPSGEEARKKVYVCPEPSCVHHNPARALGDLTGIKKHYSRKHGEKKWKCDKCGKKYAVQSDWKAHQKTCGIREYKCDCGTIFSRRDSFITHRAFCDALAEENCRVNSHQAHRMPDTLIMPSLPMTSPNNSPAVGLPDFGQFESRSLLSQIPFKPANASTSMFSSSSGSLFGSPKSVSASSSGLQLGCFDGSSVSKFFKDSPALMSATALLQKAAQMGATASNSSIHSPVISSAMAGPEYDRFQAQPNETNFATWLLQNPGPHDEAHMSRSRPGGLSMGGMGMYSGLFLGGNQGQSPTGPSRIVEGKGDDAATVDFLGIGGPEPSGTSEQRMHVVNPFPHGDSGSDIEEAMWED